MNTRIFTLIATLLCAFLDAQAPILAQPEPSYLVGMSIGLRDIDWTLDSIGSPSLFVLNEGEGPIIPATQRAELSFEMDESLYTAGFSGTVIYDRVHFSALVELPIQTENTELKTAYESQGGPGFELSDRSVSDSELDRFDINLTAGYEILQGWSLFSGYKYTEFKLKSREWNPILNNKDQKYVEEGFFIGSSYNWPFGAWGSLSLSVAYAYLNAEFSESNIDSQPPPFGFSYDEFTYEGSANGISCGLQWSGRLTGRWVYALGVKYQNYESDNNSTLLQPYAGDYALTQDPDNPLPVGVTPISVTDIDTKHTDISFSVGLLYLFGK